MIGTKILVEYYDQNESFAGFLPRTGRIEKTYKCESANTWCLLQLDDPFDYQLRLDEFEYGLIHNTHFLIRSRWQEHELGGADPTSVFILLIPDRLSVEEGFFETKKCRHVAWGMAHTLST